jgi:outer membrane protein assembly factor BamB
MKKTSMQIIKYLLMIVFSITLISSLCKKNRVPGTPTTPTGAASTYNRRPEAYRTTTTDADNNDIRYFWDWGDGKIDTTDYFLSGDTATIFHAWANAGSYSLKVKAQDNSTKLLESQWSTPLSITVVYNPPPTIDSIIGPGTRPYHSLPDRYIKYFTTTARDSTDSVYVKFMYRKKSSGNYMSLQWSAKKASGSLFRDSIKFTLGSNSYTDTFIVRAIAKDTKGSESDTSQPPYEVIITGPKWTYNTPDEYEFNSSPALGLDDQGATVLFIGGVDGYFYGIDATNGTLKWRKKTIYDPSWVPYEPEDLLNASPAVNTYFTPAHIYCGGESGELYCYEASSGTAWKWRYPDSSYENLTYNEIGSSAAIVASSNRLYVGCDDYRLYCLQDNGSSCDTVWTFYAGSEIWSSPTIDGSGNVYFGDDSGYVTSLTSTRTVRWRIRDGRIGVYSSPTIGSNAIYVGSEDGYLDALNPNTGTRLWRYTTDDGIRSSAVIGIDGSIYFGCADGKLYALEPTNGAPKPNFPIQLSDDEITSTPAIASNGSIIVYTSEDMVYSVSSSGTISWQVPLPGWSARKSEHESKKSRFEYFHPSPTIGTNGTIYVASVNGGVYAISGTTNNPLATTPWPKFRHDIKNSGRFDATK